jgi:PIN domain nuclease of toxin-antitoxin system
MRYLLDTHGLIWFLSGDARISAEARQLIEDDNNDLFVSIASLWEMAIKYSLGKLYLTQPFEVLFPAQLEANDIKVLDITIDHLQATCRLPLYHRDPFDRLIIAQAQVERLPLISTDTILDSYGVRRIW